MIPIVFQITLSHGQNKPRNRNDGVKGEKGREKTEKKNMVLIPSFTFSFVHSLF